jgi:hypothetical protein
MMIFVWTFSDVIAAIGMAIGTILFIVILFILWLDDRKALKEKRK